MNVDSAASSASSGPSGPSGSRAHRGAIASQACETCRSRKQKCDENRPKVGTGSFLFLVIEVVAGVVVVVVDVSPRRGSYFTPTLAVKFVPKAVRILY